MRLSRLRPGGAQARYAGNKKPRAAMPARLSIILLKRGNQAAKKTTFGIFHASGVSRCVYTFWRARSSFCWRRPRCPALVAFGRHTPNCKGSGQLARGARSRSKTSVDRLQVDPLNQCRVLIVGARAVHSLQYRLSRQQIICRRQRRALGCCDPAALPAISVPCGALRDARSMRWSRLPFSRKPPLPNRSRPWDRRRRRLPPSCNGHRSGDASQPGAS
jgi:hypothetical protein